MSSIQLKLHLICIGEKPEVSEAEAIKNAVASNMEQLDEAFLVALGAYIDAAEEQGDAALAGTPTRCFLLFGLHEHFGLQAAWIMQACHGNAVINLIPRLSSIEPFKADISVVPTCLCICKSQAGTVFHGGTYS